MNVGSYKYRNTYKKLVKEIFKDISKPPGKLVAVSSGGYDLQYSLQFGYRIYFDKKTGDYNCQVCSEAASKLGNNFFREYSINQEEKNTSLMCVISDILLDEENSRRLYYKILKEKT